MSLLLVTASSDTVFRGPTYAQPQVKKQQQGFVAQNLLLVLIAASVPFSQHDWPKPPVKARAPVVDVAANLLTGTLSAAPAQPFAQGDWLRPKRATPLQPDVVQNFLPLTAAPFRPVELPLPKAVARAIKAFDPPNLLGTTLATTVQSSAISSTAATASSQALTLDKPATAGNLICGGVAWGTATPSDLTSVTDDAGTGNVYTIVRRVVDTPNTSCLASYYCENVQGTPSVLTANFSTAVPFRIVFAHEVRGCRTNGALDVETGQLQAAPGTGPDAVTTGLVSPTVDGVYVFGMVHDTQQLDGPIYSPGTNFVERREVGSASVGTAESEDFIQPARAPIAATWTQSVARSALSVMLTFKPLGAPFQGPFGQLDWKLPRAAARAPDPGFQQNLLTIAPVQGAVPFAQDEWPSTRARRGVQQDALQNLLTGTLSAAPVAVPFSQSDWPLPRLVVRAPSWFQQNLLTIAPVPGAVPFRQLEWQKPTVARWQQQWSSQNLLTGTLAPVVAAPFNQDDWPQLRAVYRVTVETWRPSLALTALAVQSPFRQTEWPKLRPIRLRIEQAWTSPVALFSAIVGPSSILRGYVIQPQERSLALEQQERVLAIDLQDRVLAIAPQARILTIALQDRVLSITPQDRKEDL